jgi:hypothetical protein
MALSSLIRISTAAIAGAALAALGIWLGGGDEPVVTDDPSQPIQEAVVYLQPGETVVGPNLLIPIELEVRGTELALQYDIVPLAPPVFGVEIDLDTLPAFWRPAGGAAIAAPETWTLITTEGDTITGTTANTRSRAARFQVPEGFTIDLVDEIWIDTWRMRVPVGFDIIVERGRPLPIPLDVDSAVTLRNILDQDNNTILQLEIDSPLDSFSRKATGFPGLEDLPQLSGLGPDWTAVGPLLDSSNTGGHGIQLTYEGDGLGAVIPMEAVTTDWVVFERPIVVDLATVREILDE